MGKQYLTEQAIIFFEKSRGGSGAGSLGGAQQLTGGGVVAELFRDLQKPSRFSGGGVVAEIFRGLQEPSRFSGGGGGSSRQFSYHISTNRTHSLARERYLPHIRSSPAIFMNRSANLASHVHQQKNYSKKQLNFRWSRGGTCPPGPPWIRL